MAEFMQLEGFKELAAALRELPERLASNDLRAAVRAGANIIKKEAMANAPVSAVAHYYYRRTARSVKRGREQTRVQINPGNLRKNIIYRNIRSSGGYLTAEYIVTVRHKGNGVVGQPYAEGIYNEFGTSKMTARPFLRPAFEARKEDAVKAIGAKLDERIQKHANDLAKK